jgi:hypothetical protein
MLFTAQIRLMRSVNSGPSAKRRYTIAEPILSCERRNNVLHRKKRALFEKACNAFGARLRPPVNQKGRWKNNILVKVRSATSNNNAVNPSIQFNP